MDPTLNTSPTIDTPGSEPLRSFAPQRRKRRPLGRRGWVIVAVLVALPAMLIALKLTGWNGAAAVAHAVSFEGLPRPMLGRMHHLLFTPLGAVVVVFFRLTLGIRVLGPFRSILLAIAFQITGIALGVGFFAMVIGVVVGLRPVFKAMRLPYFGRSSAMLASVAGTIVLVTMIGIRAGLTDVERLAFFPVVVLTLAGEAFAGTLRREGIRSAAWRAGATTIVAVLIAAIASIGWLQDALVRFPEMVLWCLATVILISKLLALRLFQSLNPPPVRKKKRKRIEFASAQTATPIPVVDRGDTGNGQVVLADVTNTAISTPHAHNMTALSSGGSR